jgi:hypothetical protein
MTTKLLQFTADVMGKVLGIKPYVGQCVMLFREFNMRYHTNEAYSAEGACNLWTTRGGHPYIWDTYERVPASALRHGDWAIWSGFAGSYPNGGYGHVAMFIKNNGNGYGQFLSCNPGPVSERTLSLSGILGGLRPKTAAAPAAPAKPRSVSRIVGGRGAYLRETPRLKGRSKALLKAGSTVALVGHVAGDDATGKGDNAWGVAASGGYVNLIGLTDGSITGLPYLGK